MRTFAISIHGVYMDVHILVLDEPEI